MLRSTRHILLALFCSLLLPGAANAQDILSEADPILNRMIEIEAVLEDPASDYQQRITALRDLARVHEDFGALYDRAGQSNERELLNRWRNSAAEIYSRNNRDAIATPLGRPFAPSERRPDPNPEDEDTRVLKFTPSDLPDYDGPDSLDHVALRNQIDALQTTLYDHSFRRPDYPPPPAPQPQDMLDWDGEYNRLLRTTIYSQEQLLFNRGGGFTPDEITGLQDTYDNFAQVRTLLDEAALTDEHARDLRRRMGDVERAFAYQQSLVAQGSNMDNTWKTEWLQSAYLKMVYAMLGEELAKVDAEYSAQMRAALELAHPAEADLLAVLEARRNRGLENVAKAMPEGTEFTVHPSRGGVMGDEVADMVRALYYEQMNHPMHEGEKSADVYKDRVDGILLGFQNGELSDQEAVAALRETRDEMTRQKPYRNKREGLIKEIDRTNKEIDAILYKKSE